MSKIKEVQAKGILNKSKIYDYCVNCYTGCEHKCAYCYASLFMRRYSGHEEPWGEFVDVKVNAPEVLEKQVAAGQEGRRLAFLRLRRLSAARSQVQADAPLPRGPRGRRVPGHGPIEIRPAPAGHRRIPSVQGNRGRVHHRHERRPGLQARRTGRFSGLRAHRRPRRPESGRDQDICLHRPHPPRRPGGPRRRPGRQERIISSSTG